MTTKKQRLMALLKEKKARAKQEKTDLIKQASVSKEKPSFGGDEDIPHYELLEKLRAMDDEKIEEKIRSLSEGEMEKLYIKLEKDWGRRVDPENYKRPVIIRNFMLMWRGIKDEKMRLAEQKKKNGEELNPLTEDQHDRIFRNTGKSGVIPIANQPNRR